jgi:hypothetical protein
MQATPCVPSSADTGGLGRMAETKACHCCPRHPDGVFDRLPCQVAAERIGKGVIDSTGQYEMLRVTAG